MPIHRARWALLATLLVIALLLAGCDLPWPLNKLGRAQAPAAKPYVASLIVRDLVRENDLILAVEPQASTFPAEQVNFIIVNKWSGLAPGEHAEAAVILSPEGKEIAREEAPFPVTAADLTVALMEPFPLGALPPGRYSVVIYLDGAEQVRYPFQVVASPAQ